MVEATAYLADGHGHAPVAKPALVLLVKLSDLLFCILVFAGRSMALSMVVKTAPGHFEKL